MLHKGVLVEFQEQCADGKLDFCYGEHNTELFEMTTKPARLIYNILALVGAFLCLPAYRWRFLANTFIYIEMMLIITITFIPQGRIYHGNVYTFMFEIMAYGAASYCGGRRSAIVSILTYTVQIFFHRVLYLKGMSIGVVLYLTVRVLFFILAF